MFLINGVKKEHMLFINKFERMEKKMRKNCFWTWKRKTLFVTGAAVLLVLFGCASNFYNLGDVSEKNCALIQVSPVEQIVDANHNLLKSDYRYSSTIKIDGQGDEKQWQRPSFKLDDNKAIVRVTPGVHTFTITFFFDREYEVPLDITYNCKAGKGYSFDFLVKEKFDLAAAGFFTLDGSKPNLGIVTTTIIINEADVNEKGNFGGFYSIKKEVERKIEDLIFHPDYNGNDRGRLKKR
jgi:hypothetical protein